VTAVFSHGRLRLYLLKLLAEGPKHGYELIRLLENRFLGLYAPSAGTIYPRLQRMEAEGLVTHTAAGGRKTYEITDAGREELRQRSGELSTLEAEIHASVADLSSLASEIQNEVRGSVRDIKRELREQTRQARMRRPERYAPPWEQPAWERHGRAPESATPPEAPAHPAAPVPAPAPAPTSARAAALERQATELLTEARRLARRPGATQELLETAASAIEAALAVLRRL
jgi:DNA-binding PadR family transcriptional regulator